MTDHKHKDKKSLILKPFCSYSIGCPRGPTHIMIYDCTYSACWIFTIRDRGCSSEQIKSAHLTLGLCDLHSNVDFILNSIILTALICMLFSKKRRHRYRFKSIDLAPVSKKKKRYPTVIWCQLMQQHCACRTIVVWYQSTARATENRRSTCFRITLAVLWCHTLIVCAVLLQVEHSYTFRPLLDLESANFSPPPLRKSKILQFKSNLKPIDF